MENSLSHFFTDPKYLWLIILLALWSIPWKGVALWRAAKRGDMRWFVVLLVVNSLAILEIIYIFVFAKKKAVENQNS